MTPEQTLEALTHSSQCAKVMLYCAAHEDEIIKTTHLIAVSGVHKRHYAYHLRRLAQADLVSKDVIGNGKTQSAWVVLPSPFWAYVRSLA